MRLGIAGGRNGRGLGCALVLAVCVLLVIPPATAHSDGSAPAPQGVDMMNSAGWFGRITMKLEAEAISDISMLPDTGEALLREWRSFDGNGSSLGALYNLGWVVLAAAIAWGADRAVVCGASWRVRRRIRERDGGPTMTDLLRRLLCDALGLAVFAGVFVYSRHWLMGLGVTVPLIALAANVLIRWRIAAVICDLVLRPQEPAARLVAIEDAEACRLNRFLSLTILAIVALVGFGRYGLMDEDSGAAHVLALLVVIAVCGLDTLIIFRARALAEALIGGSDDGFVGTLRAAIARAWLGIGMAYVAGVFVFFIFGLSLGLLSYFHAAISTLGIVLVLLVLEKLSARSVGEAAAVFVGDGEQRAVARYLHRMLSALVLFAAGMTVAWLWIDASGMKPADTAAAMQSSVAAFTTLFVAYAAWELVRLAIDRNLQPVATGPKLPGDDEEETSPGSRLQTMLPMLRAAFGVLIAVVVTLIVLSRLGINTAPLIAGASVFGLAISFGAQSLVRDIISGLFYLWDDAFRVGEYIDTGRLKGTVEALGIRSVKVRHHNGPLHTIPYGQLGAVTNQSRDFATIKFNLRLERGTDIELVRKTAKQIGIAMQEEAEIATEVILPLKMQGIVDVTDTAVVFRFKFTARPVKPSWVQREYVKRIYKVFSEKGIEFARGALTLQHMPPDSVFEQAAVGDVERPVLAEALAAPARVA